MRARAIASCLLIIVVAITTAGRQPIKRQRTPAVPDDEQQLTPEEEQEARTLVERFNERLRTTNDIEPLLDEMFIRDFSERLRQAQTGGLFWTFLNKNLVASASPDELQRFYVASMNSFQLYFKLYEAIEYSQKQSEDKEEELNPKDVLSPEIINVLLSDPTLAELAREIEEEEQNDRAKENDNNQSAENRDSSQAAGSATETDAATAKKKDEMDVIKNVTQLKSISATLEKANELMRKRVSSMLPLPSIQSNEEDTESQSESQKDSLRFYQTSLDEGEFGCPKGTEVIHVDVLPYCLYLIRIEGQLKILSATIYMD